MGSASGKGTGTGLTKTGQIPSGRGPDYRVRGLSYFKATVLSEA